MYVFLFCCTASTEISTLSLHDALPILVRLSPQERAAVVLKDVFDLTLDEIAGDRKSTRLNSSHLGISYAVFCLKKKKTIIMKQKKTSVQNYVQQERGNG